MIFASICCKNNAIYRKNDICLNSSEKFAGAKRDDELHIQAQAQAQAHDVLHGDKLHNSSLSSDAQAQAQADDVGAAR